ncbi:MAG: nitrile hydratase accessory protein [Phenylobacterium sp.]|nr:MAG: nitrile hydratase accessory protein [Phenylobacterium sp.]
MLSPPDLLALPQLPKDAPQDSGGPVFAEPWQAQAFALALRLHAQGAFTWPEWAQALSEELKAAGPMDDPAFYYERWLAALERLAIAKRLAGRQALADRKSAWADAYRRTPHGKPITL